MSLECVSCEGDREKKRREEGGRAIREIKVKGRGMERGFVREIV